MGRIKRHVPEGIPSGTCQFRKGPEAIDLPALIQELDQIPVQPDLAV
jgi:hypothetical protein